MIDFEIEDILDKVRESEVLGKSDRQYNLLKFLLEQTHAGKADLVKEYQIAVDVFGRAEDFDPAIDSIVRVEMHRLRKHLKSFSNQQQIEIRIPRASYKVKISKPVERKNSFFLMHGLTRRIHKKLLLTLVLLGFLSFLLAPKFESILYPGQTSLCATGMPNLDIQAKFDSRENKKFESSISLEVELLMQQYQMVNFVSSAKKCLKSGTPTYSLTFSDRGSPELILTLTSLVDQSVLWSENVTFDHSSPLNQTLAKPVYALARFGGVIHRESISENWDNAFSKREFECLYESAIYMHSGETQDLKSVHSCLTILTESDDPRPETLAMLASHYLDQARGYQDVSVQDPLSQAKVLIDRIRPEEFGNDIVLHTQLRYYSLRQPVNTEQLRLLVDEVKSQQPFNLLPLITASQISGFILGDWKTAREINEQIYSVFGQSDPYIAYVDVAAKLIDGDYRQAFTSSNTLYSERVAIANIFVFAAAYYDNNQEWQIKANQNLENLGFDDLQKIKRFIDEKKYEPSINSILQSAFDPTFQSKATDEKICFSHRPSLFSSIKNSVDLDKYGLHLDHLNKDLNQYFSLNIMKNEAGCASTLSPTLKLEIFQTNSDSNPKLHLRLLNFSDDELLYSAELSMLNSLDEIRTQLARHAYEIAHPSKSVFRKIETLDWPNTRNQDQFKCINSAFDYYVDFADENREPLLTCLMDFHAQPNHLVEIDTTLAYLLYEHLRGYESISVDNPELLFEELMKEAEDKNADHPEFGIMKMRQFLYFDRPFKLNPLLSLIEKFSQDQPTNPHMLNQISNNLNKIEVDLDHAKSLHELASKLEPSFQSLWNQFLPLYEFSSLPPEEAFASISNLNIEGLPTQYLLKYSLMLELNIEPGLEQMQETMKLFNLGEQTQICAFIENSFPIETPSKRRLRKIHNCQSN